MIKSRYSYLCNLKFVLIVLVVLGHCLEQAQERDSALYRMIYLFHMPLFAFVTGLHLRKVRSCLKQARAAVSLYIGIQGVIVPVQVTAILCGISAAGLPQTVFSVSGILTALATPFWHLWYLLSMCMWALAAALGSFLYEKCIRGGSHPGGDEWKMGRILGYLGKVLGVLAAVAGALLCGALPMGRFLSLSRTVCFFPYVLLGVFCPEGLQEGIRLKNRCLMAVAGGLGAVPATAVLRRAPCEFFYRADGYGKFSLSVSEGCFLRGVCFVAALCLGMLLLALVPSARLPVTKIGGDTLPAYLLHVVFVPFAAAADGKGGFFYGGIAVFSILIVLFLWELGRWFRPVYTVLRRG